jgi:hypothetical protein
VPAFGFLRPTSGFRGAGRGLRRRIWIFTTKVASRMTFVEMVMPADDAAWRPEVIRPS